MQARITRTGEVVVVHLIGRVDVETAEPFRDACLRPLLNEKVVFNFSELSFVGSSGIIPFLETMKSFAETSGKGFKFCAVGSEFRKIFAASPLGHIEIFENEVVAADAFANPSSTALPPFPIGSELFPEMPEMDEIAELDGMDSPPEEPTANSAVDAALDLAMDGLSDDDKLLS